MLLDKRVKCILFIYKLIQLRICHQSKIHIVYFSLIFWKYAHWQSWGNHDVRPLHDIWNVDLFGHWSVCDVGDRHVWLLCCEEHIFICWWWTIVDFTWVFFYLIKGFLLICFKLRSNGRSIYKIRIYCLLKQSWKHQKLMFLQLIIPLVVKYPCIENLILAWALVLEAFWDINFLFQWFKLFEGVFGPLCGHEFLQLSDVILLRLGYGMVRRFLVVLLHVVLFNVIVFFVYFVRLPILVLLLFKLSFNFTQLINFLFLDAMGILRRLYCWINFLGHFYVSIAPVVIWGQHTFKCFWNVFLNIKHPLLIRISTIIFHHFSFISCISRCSSCFFKVTIWWNEARILVVLRWLNVAKAILSSSCSFNPVRICEITL